jgi:gamma-glutamyltranspeptidase/glutathione hydrolase
MARIAADWLNRKVSMAVPFDWKLPYPASKMPVLARNLAATTQPLAAQAGARMLLKGGNAVDAAVATAIALTVVEPIMNGIGGDLYAMVWDEGQLHGLNSTGESPAAWHAGRFSGYTSMPMKGWDSVTVPGGVAGWKALSARFGRLPFEALFEPAIAYARDGFLVSPFIASVWEELASLVSDQPGFSQAFLRDGRPPRPGELWRNPDQARSLQAIAETGAEAFYRGRLAEAIVDFSRRSGGCITMEDLASHEVEWVEPLGQDYRGYTLHEIPPNGQGIAALMALGILEHFDMRAMALDSAASYHVMIEAMKLAFADLYEHVSDPRTMRLTTADLLSPAYLKERARLIDLRRASAPRPGAPRQRGTVYLTTADASGMMVSLIQSNYWAFGSGLVVPGTGISLHNRGANFSLVRGHPNEVAPRKKPLHTIIPAFVTRAGQPVMSFGVMGGAMQAQGHLQMMSRLVDFGQNPQAMSDAPRFLVESQSDLVSVEEHLPASVLEGLRQLGHKLEVAPTGHLKFGATQIIHRLEHGYLGVSDSRRDGQPVGF